MLHSNKFTLKTWFINVVIGLSSISLLFLGWFVYSYSNIESRTSAPTHNTDVQLTAQENT